MGCCDPPGQPPANNGGGGGGCCPPKPSAGAPSSCCPPKPTPTPATAAAPAAAPPPPCCPPSSSCWPPKPDATGALLPGDADAVRASVSEYYGATLTSTNDLKTAACCTKTPPPLRVRQILSRVPAEIKDRYYGCGSPWPAGLKGRKVLDLGCGTGRDVYVASALVGEKGYVIGVDMTEAQLDVGRRHRDAWARELGFEKPNVRFVKGRIEELPSAPAEEKGGGGAAPSPAKCGAGGCGAGGGCGGGAQAAAGTTDAANADDDDSSKGVPASWADVIISNCVVNLSPDKPAVLKGAFATLAPGGEMHFSDVYCSRRLARAARSHPIAVGECLGGALFTDDFLSLCRDAGFARPRVAAAREFEVHDAELKEVLGEGARFFSVTFRVFKLRPPEAGAWARGEGGGNAEDDADADTRVVPEDAARGFALGGCQDFGQTATYLGTVEDHPDRFELDLTAAFEKGRVVGVCAATAAALARTWLAPHFEVTAPGPHKGAFVGCGVAGCGGSGAAAVQRLADEEEARFAAAAAAAKAAAGGGGGGGCCPPAGGKKGGCC